MKSVLFFLAILCYGCFTEQSKAICNSVCKGLLPKDGYVTEFCDTHKLTMQGRCCANGTGTSFKVLGIDLRNCSLTKLSGLFTNLTSLNVISAEENEVLNVSAVDFEGLTKIEYLSLSSNLSCPGGYEAWEVVKYLQHHTLCLNESDYCNTYNISCPANSRCVNFGPGLNHCLCSSGYYGYKCLRYGTFPVTIFASALSGSTFLIAGLLWCTERRKVKKNA